MKKWPVVQLKDVATIDWGNTTLTKSSFVELGPYLGVSAAGIDGRMDHFEHEAGTTVISAIGANCGRVFYLDEKFTAIKNTMTVTPIREKILPRYLYLLLSRNSLPKRGGGQPFISKGDAQKYPIPVPPLSIQREIVSTLDSANDLKKKREEADKKMASFAPALFHQMFGDPGRNERGWEVRRVGNLVENLDSKRKPITKSDRIVGDVPYYGAMGILDYVQGHIFDEKLVLIGEDGAKWGPGENSAFIIEGKSWVNNHAHALRPIRSKVIDEYLVAALVVMDLQKYITGITVPKLNQSRLNSIDLPLPPINLQKQFADFVIRTHALRVKQQESAKKIGATFEALIEELI